MRNITFSSFYLFIYCENAIFARYSKTLYHEDKTILRGDIRKRMLCRFTRRPTRYLVQSNNKQDFPDSKASIPGTGKRFGMQSKKSAGGLTPAPLLF